MAVNVLKHFPENWAPLGTRPKTGAQFGSKPGTRKSAGQDAKGAQWCPVFPLLRKGARNLSFSLTCAHVEVWGNRAPLGTRR